MRLPLLNINMAKTKVIQTVCFCRIFSLLSTIAKENKLHCINGSSSFTTEIWELIIGEKRKQVEC